MVFVSLIELGVKGTIFVVQQTYYLGRYLIWGSQKSREDLLEEKFQQQINRENQLIEELRLEIRELKESKTHSQLDDSSETTTLKIDN
jgi:hypothetical protein